eukprot:1160311-Pelagomonas_calceolata.AAC.1
MSTVGRQNATNPKSLIEALYHTGIEGLIDGVHCGVPDGLMPQGQSTSYGSEIAAEMAQLAKPRYHFATGQVGRCHACMCVCARAPGLFFAYKLKDRIKIRDFESWNSY